MAGAQMAAAVAVLVLGSAGCSSSTDRTGADRSPGGSAQEPGVVAEGGPQITPSVGKELPSDFPDGVPLPSSVQPTAVSAGRVPGGKKLWSISYAGDVTRVSAEERAALHKAEYTVILEAADGTGSYVKDMTSVVTAMRNGTFVIMVTTLA